MLSKGIMVINFDVTRSVKKLIEQRIENSLNLEILAYNDGSHRTLKRKNRLTAPLKEVRHKKLPVNMRSAAMCNKMATNCSFDYIWFLDNNFEIPDEYIKSYILFLNSNKQRVCVDRIYPKTLPSQKKSLRRKVVQKKGDFSSAIQNKVLNISIMSYIFAIKNFILKNKIRYYHPKT